MSTAPPPTKRRKTTTQPTLDACWGAPSRHGAPSLVEACLATLVMSGHADVVPESLRWRLQRLVAPPGTEPREPCGVCESTRCDGTACLQCQNFGEDGGEQCDNLRPCGDDGVPTDEYCARCRNHWERHRGALPVPYDACGSVACGDVASD